MKYIIVFLLLTFSVLAQGFADSSPTPDEPGASTFSGPKHWGDGIEYYFIATAQDSGDISSNIMTEILDYDNDLTNYPWAFELTVDTLAANDEIIAVYLQGKTGVGTWFNLDTLVAEDTINGSHTGLTNLRAAGTLDCNSSRAPQYRLLIDASHDSGNTYSVSCSIYAYKRD